jgi:hypothetical protein
LDKCTQCEKEALEKLLQYEAARVVTGLTRAVSIPDLLNEIGWLSLDDGRKLQNFILIYIEKLNLLPLYLSQLFPTTVEHVSSLRSILAAK